MINLADYNDFFFFLGGFLVIGGVIYLLFRHSLQNVFIAEQEAERLISEEEISKLKDPDQTSTHKILLRSNKLGLLPETFRNVNLRFSLLSKILLAIIVGGFLFNQVLMWRMNSSNFLSKLFNINITITKK